LRELFRAPDLDPDQADAEQAARILDRLVLRLSCALREGPLPLAPAGDSAVALR